jgi:hypothetical protein
MSSKIVRYGGGFIGLCLLAIMLVAIFGPKHADQPHRGVDSAANAPVDYDRPLETVRGTLVCPFSLVFDNREGRGLQAAVKSRLSTFSRLEEAQKAGCDEWRAGIPINLSQKAIADAKQLQASHNCGMVEYDANLIFMCELKNQAVVAQQDPPTATAVAQWMPSAPSTGDRWQHIKWGASARLAGTLSWGEFDDCCYHGQAKHSRYLLLELDKPFILDSDKLYVSDATEVQRLQVSTENLPFDSIQPGRVVVFCQQIDPGDTGHYAQPIYCGGATLAGNAK